MSRKHAAQTIEHVTAQIAFYEAEMSDAMRALDALEEAGTLSPYDRRYDTVNALGDLLDSLQLQADMYRG
jgi:hypothetical protein